MHPKRTEGICEKKIILPIHPGSHTSWLIFCGIFVRIFIQKLDIYA